MKIQWTDLGRWRGTVERGPYLLVGVLGFAIKHNIDRFVASVCFDRPWQFFNYWIPPGDMLHFASLPRDDVYFLATLLALALPFLWIGIALTLRRLRALRWPLWFVIFFFAPYLNLLFFLLLAAIPSYPTVRATDQAPNELPRRWLDRWIPHGAVGSAALAIGLTAGLGTIGAIVCAQVLQFYGWGLFVGGPFVLGLGAVLLHGYHAPRSLWGSLFVATLAVGCMGLLLIALAVEGFFCLAMALPIAEALALLGAVVGYVIQRQTPRNPSTPIPFVLLILAVPALLAAERVGTPPPPLLAVRTSIDIDAPAENVWEQVVAFTEIPSPREWIFRFGIAYPIRAEITGHGIGATRRCVFSTGTFVEPIEVWDAPRLLRFRVTAQPPPMIEWTPYQDIAPPHLDGYLQSQQGQFLLTVLPGGQTRLEGTTWYRNAMWPTMYWQLWSDWILHQIHHRVLHHIQAQAEASTARRFQAAR